MRNFAFGKEGEKIGGMMIKRDGKMDGKLRRDKYFVEAKGAQQKAEQHMKIGRRGNKVGKGPRRK